MNEHEQTATMEHTADIDRLQQNRNRVIVRTSVIGILANLALAGLKAVIGLAANSIAVILDAVNNLSDALSSVITIIGTHLASKAPDQKHPLGHGRAEYLSAMVVSALVLYAGITSLVESVKKIITPEAADYSVLSLVIIASAVVVKLLLGSYVKAQGKKVNSGSLIASGSDALFDAILSASVLLSALIYFIWGLSLEAYVGVLLSAYIIKSGVEMLLDTFDEILGKRADRDFVNEIKQTICEEEWVSGAYDLILHSYGPEKMIGSVHVEVPDTLTAEDIDRMERRIAQRVYQQHGVILTGIGIYALNTQNDEIRAMRSRVTRIVLAHDGVLQIHGFFVDMEKKTLHLDIILDFALPDRGQTFADICAELRAAYPDFELMATMDIDA